MFSMGSKPTISRFLKQGDSLTDRGTLNHRYLFGFIPLSWLSGLTGRSPLGRFTNGFTWSDHFSAIIADKFIIQDAKKDAHKNYRFNAADAADDVLNHRFKPQPHSHLDNTDIGDNVISDKRFDNLIRHSYTLDNDLYVNYKGHDLVRCYDEGGLTSHDYSWIPSTSISRFFSRLMLSTLSAKREKIIEYDKRHAVTKEQKKDTLVVEWSGANDLITVNARPSKAEADKAIRERLLNAEILIKKGYRNIVLFNLPDLSLTPRYQRASESERKNAHEITNYFNQKLQIEYLKLQTRLRKENYDYHDCSINIFNVNKIFNEVYQDTLNEKKNYPFDKSKLRTPYTESKDFHLDSQDHLSPANGYMFYDDVHPSADMHALLADKFNKFVNKHYNVVEPNEVPDLTANELVSAYVKKYNKKYKNDYFGFFNLIDLNNSFINSLNDKPAKTSLRMILKHALYENGNRTRAVLLELGWIDKNSKINTRIPCLKDAAALLLDDKKDYSLNKSVIK